MMGSSRANRLLSIQPERQSDVDAYLNFYYG